MNPSPPTSELAVNLWAYIDQATGMVYAISGRAYALAGKDDDKLAILRQLAPTDLLTAKRQALPKHFKVTDGQETREGMTYPRTLHENVAGTFEGVYQSIESDLPPTPNFLTGKHTPQRIPQNPLFLLTFLVEDDQGNVTPITSRDLSRDFCVDQVKRQMMDFIGLSPEQAEKAAREWAEDQDQQNKSGNLTPQAPEHVSRPPKPNRESGTQSPHEP